MQQPSQHGSWLSLVRVSVWGFLWWAVVNTSIAMPDGGVYSSIHGPFQTGDKCLTFVRLFVSTYDDRASGANIARAFCVEPYKKRVIK